MAEKEKSSGTLVTGLDRLGSAVTATLSPLEREILGVGSDSALVERFSPTFPVVEANASRLDAMEQFDTRDFSAAVARVDTLKASVLITTNLVDIGIEQIWVKAVSREQGKILRRIETHRVIYPEFDTGRHTAYLVDERILDYVEMGREGFSIAKVRLPAEIQGFAPAESDVQCHYGVNILGMISPERHSEHAGPDTAVAANDLIIISRDGKLLDDFANQP